MDRSNIKRIVSHQAYSEISDPKVRNDICEFHGKQQYPLIPTIKGNASLLTNLTPNEASRLIENEIEFWPGLCGEIFLERDSVQLTHNQLVRNRSADHFSDRETVKFEDIKKLMRSALCRRVGSGNDFSRFYASAGALYPIEVFICRLSNKIESWPESSNVLHLRANSLELESMCSTFSMSELLQAICGSSPEIGSPHFVLIYAAFIDKFIFKYKRRGYRHALMEIGSMYMMTDLVGKQIGLKNRIWSGFFDNLIADALNVDTETVLPCVAQLFGANNATPFKK